MTRLKRKTNRMNAPIIYTSEEKIINSAFMDNVRDDIVKRGEPDKTILLDYPTVYIHYWNTNPSDPDSKYDIYIGESNDVIDRTKQGCIYGGSP